MEFAIVLILQLIASAGELPLFPFGLPLDFPERFDITSDEVRVEEVVLVVYLFDFPEIVHVELNSDQSLPVSRKIRIYYV